MLAPQSSLKTGPPTLLTVQITTLNHAIYEFQIRQAPRRRHESYEGAYIKSPLSWVKLACVELPWLLRGPSWYIYLRGKGGCEASPTPPPLLPISTRISETAKTQIWTLSLKTLKP